MLRAKWEALCDELGLFPDLERRVQVYQAFQSGARDHHLLEVYREARDNQAVREALKVWFHDRFAQASLKSGVPSAILSDATLANTATRFNAEEGVPAREAMLHEYAAHFSLMDDEAPLAFLPPVDGTAVRKVYLGLSSRLLSLDRTARLGHVLDMLDRLDDEALHRKLMFALTARFAIRGFKGSRAAGRRWAEREKFVAGRLAAVDAQFPPIVDLLAEMAQRSAFSRDGLMDGIGEEGADIPSLRRRLAEIGLGRLAEGLFMDTRIALQEPNFEDLPEGAVKSVEDLGYDPREILSPSLTVSSELHLDDGIDTDFFIGGLRFIEVASYSRLEDNFGYDRAIDQDSALSLEDAVDEDGLERFLNLESEMDLADNGPGVAIEDMTWTLGFRDESPLTDAIGPDVNIMASDASDLSDAFGIDASAGHSSALGMSDDFTLSAFFDESSVLGPTDETDLLSRPVRDVSSSLTLRDSLAEDPQASLSELASMADLTDALSLADVVAPSSEIRTADDGDLTDDIDLDAGMEAIDALDLQDMTSAARDSDILSALALSDAHAAAGAFSVTDGLDLTDAAGNDASIQAEGGLPLSDGTDAFTGEAALSDRLSMEDALAFVSEIEADAISALSDAFSRDVSMDAESGLGLGDLASAARLFELTSSMTPSDAHSLEGDISFEDAVSLTATIENEEITQEESGLDLADEASGFVGAMDLSDGLSMADMAGMDAEVTAMSDISLSDNAQAGAGIAATDELGLADDHDVLPALAFSDGLGLLDAIDGFVADKDAESALGMLDAIIIGEGITAESRTDLADAFAFESILDVASHADLRDMAALHSEMDASSGIDMDDAHLLGDGLTMASEASLADEFAMAGDFDAASGLSPSDAMDPPGPILEMDDEGVLADGFVLGEATASHTSALDLRDLHAIFEGVVEESALGLGDAADLAGAFPSESELDLGDDGLPHAATAAFEDEEVLADDHAGAGESGSMDALAPSDAVTLDLGLTFSDALSLTDAVDLDSVIRITVDWDIPDTSDPESFIHPSEHDLDGDVFFRTGGSIIVFRYRDNDDSEVRAWGNVAYIESNNWLLNGVALTFPTPFNNNAARVTDPISNADRDRILGLADASSALDLGDAFALGQPLHEFVSGLNLEDVFSIAQEKAFSDDLSISDAIDVLPGLDALGSLSLSDSAEAFRGTLGLADDAGLDDALEMLGSIRGTEALDLGDGMALASETEAEDAASLTDAIQEDGSFGETSEETMEDDAQLEAGLTFTDALELSDAADFDSTVRITVDWRISDPSDPDTFIHPDSHDLDGDVFHRTSGPVLVFRYRTNDDSEIRAWGDLDTISGTSWILNGLSVSFPNPFGGGTARVTDANISNADRDRILGLADADSALDLTDGSAVDAAGSTHVEDGGLSDALSLGAASFPRESALSLGDQVELFVVRRGTVAWDIDLDNIQSWVPPDDTDLPTDIFYRAGGARILSFGYRQNNASVMVAWGDLDEIGNGVWEINGVQVRFETATSNGTALRTGYDISDADRDRILGLATHESTLSLAEASSAGDAEFRSSDAMAMADEAALDVGLAASDALALSDRAVLAQTIDATVDWDIDDPSDPPSFINHAATDLDTSVFYRTGGNFVVLRYRTSNDSDVRFWGDLDAIRAATITLNGVTLTIARDVSGGVGTLENISNAVRDRILGIMAQTDALDLADDAELEAEGLSATSSLSPSDALDAPVLETGFTDALDLTDSVTLEVAGTALSGTVDWDIDDPSDPGTFVHPSEHDLDAAVFYRTNGSIIILRYRNNNDSEVRAWGDVDAIEASPVTINGIELTFATPFNNNNARVTGPISNAVRDRILGLMDQTSILDLADNADLVTDLVRTGTVAWDVRLPNIQAFVPPLSTDLPTAIFYRAGGLRILSFDYNTNGNSAVIAWGDVDEIENGIWEINGVQLRFTASASNNTARRTDYNISNADRDRILGLMDQSSPMDLADDAALDVGGLSATSSMSLSDALDAPVLEHGFTDALSLTDAAVLDSSTTIYGTVDWNIADPSNPGTFVHPSEHDLDAAVFYRTGGSIIILRYRNNNDSEVRAWGDVDLIEASDISINGVSLSFPNPFNNNNARVTDADISNADRDRILGLMDQTDALDLTDDAALEATVPVGADDLTWDGDPIQWDGENVSWIGGSAMDVEIEATDALSLSDATSGLSGEMDADSALDLSDESVIGRPLLRWLQEETNYDAAISEVNADEHGDDLIVDANDADAVPNPVVLDGDATDEIDTDVILHGGIYIGRTSTLTPSDAVTLEVGAAEPPAEELSNFDRIAAMEGSFAVRITAEDDATDYWEVSDNEGTLLESHPDDMFDNTAVFWIERFGYQTRGRIRMHRGDSTVSFRNEIATSAYTLVIIDETDEEYMMIEARSYTTAGDGYALYDVDGFSVEASDTGGQSRADWLGSRHEHELVLAFITDSSWRPSF